jgi:hypothetical protein
MRSISLLAMGWLAAAVIGTPVALAQPRPYIGYVYPAGGRQGATSEIRLGGQNLDDVSAVRVSGSGVTAKVVDYYWRQNNQEQALLNEQLRLLKRKAQAGTKGEAARTPAEKAAVAKAEAERLAADPALAALIDKIQRRTQAFVQTPACASLASLLFVEVTVAPDAEPGDREIRLVTARGVSNPLPFIVGQLPEYSRSPMRTATIQVLGKEAQSLRKRPAEEVEDRVTLPATLNGQIASGEVNRYRFTAHKGQVLVFTTLARQLVPYIADAVPGWFQPVLQLTDASGKEVAYNDDYRFKPDPTLIYETPADGEYVLTIHDSLYRGREDFVYRITAGELPFVSNIFPLGGPAGAPINVKMQGWNLEKTQLAPPPANAAPGVYRVAARRDGFVTNRVPFAMDALPETFDKEPNNDLRRAQRVTLPLIVNGRIDKPGDWDVFQFNGKANQTIAAEVYARRLDSPLDSVLKLTDAKGKVLTFNDDHDDIGSGLNTHHADSYLMTKLPADGVYYIHIGDTAHSGGDAYAYRLRISEAQPDFELRVAPSSISLRTRGAANVSVYVIRRDGFTSPIKLALKNAPAGIMSAPATLSPTQAVTQMTLRTSLAATREPIKLEVEGRALVAKKEVVRQATPAEDRMEAFLWRHLLPAQDFESLVFDPAYQPPPKRIPPNLPDPAVEPQAAKAPVAAANGPDGKPKPKFSQQQVASRLRDLKRLYGAGFLTDDFYLEKLAECQVTQ